MKKTIVSVILICVLQFIHAQRNHIDSLKQKIASSPDDTTKVKLLYDIGQFYNWSYADTGLLYAQNGLRLSEKLNYEKGQAYSMYNLGASLTTLGDYANALNFGFKALALSKKLKEPGLIIYAYGGIGDCYKDQGDYKKALENFYEALRLTDLLHIDKHTYNAYYSFTYYPYLLGSLSATYEKSNQLDSALYYGKKAWEIKQNWSYLAYTLGSVHTKLGDKELALDFYKKGISLAIQENSQKDIVDVYNGMAKLYKKERKKDSAVYYAKQAMTQEWSNTYPIGILEASSLLAGIYESDNKDSTLKYLKLTIALKDSLFSNEKTRAAQSLAFKEQIYQQQLASEKEQIQNKFRMYALIGVLLVFLLIAFLLWRNNRHKQIANVLLNQQKEKIETTLVELKSTQSQLIQSEKMASLGELTAGIAHEIQNPLNFVNNFSDVNKELLVEMKDEIDNGNLQEVKSIANDVIDNEQKINHHGKRADTIVKGMLQHSRSNTNQKEPTDINKLADEYLRLCYHGLRAKDQFFNATIQTDFDQSLDKINIIPQDIGRVLLNLYTNAFYAVSEKKKEQPEARLNDEVGQGYEPTVSVTTKRISDKVEIKVADNGNGIPQKVLDKILQPFFTTKPTGQGTGLGLSLSYDIVKAHGGELKVETTEGKGAEFIISLPYP
jgi:signal transduction histidine kinase